MVNVSKKSIKTRDLCAIIVFIRYEQLSFNVALFSKECEKKSKITKKKVNTSKKRF